jgi:hypothetical protein
MIGEYSLGNAHTFNGHTDENILLIMMNKTFDDIARSLMEYYYVLPRSGLHFIIHQQSLLLLIKRIAPTCRSTLQFFKDDFNIHQINVLSLNIMNW